MRTDQIKAYIATGLFAVEPKYMQSLIASVNAGLPTTDDTVAESHSYEVVGEVAIIKVDATTTKTHTFINAACGGFVGYDTLVGYYEKAEADNDVKKILLVLDTRGGDVANVDTLREAIAKSKKETITLYENIGASAGIWYGTASDKVYAASPTTTIGSIGVMAGYRENKDSDTIFLVSRNAENKNCTINGDCEAKIQKDIDRHEKEFLSVVSKNTGMEVDTIVSSFNHGDTISAEEALEIGFIDGIKTRRELLEEITPPATAVNSNRGNGGISIQGHTMTVEEELKESQSTIDALKAELAGKDTETVASVIAANINAIPVAMRGDEKLIALASNPETTEADMKAALWDMSETQKETEKQASLEENKKMQEVETETPEKNIETPDEAIKYAKDGSIDTITVEIGE